MYIVQCTVYYVEIYIMHKGTLCVTIHVHCICTRIIIIYVLYN